MAVRPADALQDDGCVAAAIRHVTLAGERRWMSGSEGCGCAIAANSRAAVYGLKRSVISTPSPLATFARCRTVVFLKPCSILLI